MQQLMCTEPGTVLWQDIPEPALLGPGEALVRPLAVARCDIDLFLTSGGKLLVATGALAIVAGLTLGITVTLAVVTASVLATAVITAAYSYHIWKTDPDRRHSRD